MNNPRRFRIPKKFMLHGQKWTVTFDDGLAHREDAVGLCLMRENKILLQSDTKDYPRPKSQIEQTYFHELLHAAFDQLGEKGLRDNEALVDTLASLIHQALTTAEYE